MFQQNVFTRQEKGWTAMRTDIRKYLVHTTQTNRLILDYLIDHEAFDKTKAKKIKEIAEGLQLHPTYLGQALKEMYASGWLIMFKESKVVHYYINNERANCLSQTVLPESVEVKTSTKKPKPKKTTPSPEKKENALARELFDLYLSLYPKKGAYKYREDKIERAIKDYDFETIKAVVQWFPSNEWWNENGRVDLYNNILAPTRIDDWISQMSAIPALKNDKPKETEEERRARIKWEKRKEESQRFLAEQRGSHEVAEPNKTKKRFQIV